MAAAGDAQNSEKELLTAAGLMPNSARPHVALGNLQSLKGQDDQAISESQTALKLDPRNAGTYVLMGMAEKKRGHADLAEKAYRQALDTLGWAYHVNGENGVCLANSASQTLKRAVAAAPEDPRLSYHLAVVYGAQGHKQEEQATLRKALATNKPFPEMKDAKTRLAANKGVS